MDNISLVVAFCLIGQTQVGARYIFKIRVEGGVPFGLRLGK